MVATDFIIGFGRLLRDGNLRDIFAVNPRAAAEQIQLMPADFPAWSQLISEDVEFQADVLLRKRLDLVKFFAPEMSRRLGKNLWPAFHQYSRTSWPPTGSAKISDAIHFFQHLKQSHPTIIVASEWNRLAFAFSKQKAALHWIKMANPKGKTRHGLQFLYHGRNKRWMEFFFHLGF